MGVFGTETFLGKDIGDFHEALKGERRKCALYSQTAKHFVLFETRYFYLLIARRVTTFYRDT